MLFRSVIFSSATTSCGIASALLTVVPTRWGRPKLSHARYQHSAARPKPSANALEGTPPGRKNSACSPSSVRATQSRQDTRGPQRANRRAGLELDPPHHPPQFARARAVVEALPSSQRLRQQFRVLLHPLGQLLTVPCHVLHTPLIVHFTLERHADMLAPTGWGLLLQSWVVHHSTVWRISALPSQLFFSLLGYPQNPLAPEILKGFGGKIRTTGQNSGRALY